MPSTPTDAREHRAALCTAARGYRPAYDWKDHQEKGNGITPFMDSSPTVRSAVPPPVPPSVPSRDDSPLSGVDERFGFGDVGGEAEELPAGTNLGSVTIVRLLAAGGMGSVYEGVQAAPRRTVAVKVVQDDFLAPDIMERFAREAEVLARLRHPHIAQIYTFGSHDAVHFFVMEMVEAARTITRYATDLRLSVRDRIILFQKVCGAVAHGHSLGIVHRDLKPGNILVDCHGAPKVIDFGVARSLDTPADVSRPGRVGERLVASPLITADGELVGTLQYMSPEQLRGDVSTLDARSDVYSLGLVLHELIVGTLPYDLRDASAAEVVRIAGGEAAPSTAAVAQAAAECRADDARCLSVIVARCLEKAAADRYASAAELEAELGRWLDGRPILARPPTPLESARRFARRHRVAAIATSAAVASLVAGLIGIAAFSVQADRQRRAADEARAAAERDRSEANRQAAKARSQLYFSNVLLAAEARDRDNVAEARRLLDSARALVADAGTMQPIELECLAASLDDAIQVRPGDGGTIKAVCWSPVSDTLAAGDEHGNIRLWLGCQVASAGGDSSGGERLLKGHAGSVWSVAFSPDGATLVSAGADGEVLIHDVASGTVLSKLGMPGPAVYSAVFTRDGGALVTASRDGSARIWDVATGRQRAEFVGHEGTVYAACPSADGTLLATAALDGTARLWDAASGSERAVLNGHDGRVFDLAFSPDGRSIATASEDGTARVWDVATATERWCFRHPFRVNAIAFVGRGDRLATASGDGVLRIWDTSRGIEIMRLRGHTAPLWSIAGRPGTNALATGAADGTVRVWDVGGETSAVLRTDDRVPSAAFAPDGGMLAIALATGRVQLWDTTTCTVRGELTSTAGRVNSVVVSPAGDLIVAGCDDGVVSVWTRDAQELVANHRVHDRRIYSVAFSPDGMTFATASEDRTVRLCSTASATERVAALRHPSRVFCAAFTPDGAAVATACEDRIARLWDVQNGTELRRFAGHEGPVNWVAFSGDGARLATASSDGTVRVWRVADGEVIAVLKGPSRQVWKVAFSPDSTRVAAVSADGTAQLWDADSGRAALMLRGHTDQVWAVAFAPDGRSLVTGSWDGTARLWGVSPGEIARRRSGRGR